MKKFMQTSSVWLWTKWSLLKREEGQGMVEYGLIIALVAVAVVVALTAMGTQIGTLFTNITKSL